MKEAGVEQVQNGVFNAANILIHGQPIIRLIAVDHAFGVVWAGEASVVPRRLNKGVEGIGLALAGLSLKLKPAPFGIGLDG